jgi:integrase
VWWGILKTSPASGIPALKEVPNPPELLSAEEVAHLISLIDIDVRAAVGLGVYAGLRKMEILRLEWTNVNLIEKITIYQLRHAFCSHALMKGVDARTVQSWMGPPGSEHDPALRPHLSRPRTGGNSAAILRDWRKLSCTRIVARFLPLPPYALRVRSPSTRENRCTLE